MLEQNTILAFRSSGLVNHEGMNCQDSEPVEPATG
jgi:hypothetical protein